MPAFGRSTKASTMPAIPFVGTTVSGLSTNTASGVGVSAKIWRKARLLPAEKPLFCGEAINRTHGNASRTMATLSSDEALSTTHTSSRPFQSWSASEAKHGFRTSPELKLRITTAIWFIACQLYCKIAWSIVSFG